MLNITFLSRAKTGVAKALRLVGIFLTVGTLSAQIYVANLDGSVGAYSKTGTPLNPSFITGLFALNALAYNDGFLYTGSMVGNGDSRTMIGKYNLHGERVATYVFSGAQEYYPAGLAFDQEDNLYVAYIGGQIWKYSPTGGALYITPLTHLPGNYPGGLVFGPNGHLYANSGYGSITEFTTAGQIVNNWNFPDLGYPGGLVVEGNNIYSLSQSFNRITKFTTSGAVVNFNLAGGFIAPWGLASNGAGTLYVSDNYLNRISTYNTGGQLLNANFITAGLHNPSIILVVPEPSCLTLTALGALGVFVRWPARRTSGSSY